jgi:hypothetical protein
VRLRLLIALMALSTVGCRAILGIDDDPPISSSGTGGGSASGGASSNSGGSGGGVSDPHWARFEIPSDSPPATKYSVVGERARDLVTGLEWERDPPRQNVSQASAAARCAKLGDGFRLPNRIELETIWDFAAPGNKLRDSGIFATLGSSTTEFWTSSHDVQGNDGLRFWTVEFQSIGASEAPAGGAFPEAGRCVRVASSHPTLDPHYVVKDGVVRDQWTGLSWDLARPVKGKAGAKSRCKNLQLGAFASGWRLPMTKELLSIWDETQQNPPYWDPSFGKADATDTIYWTGTPEIEDPPTSYGVGFVSGGPTGTSLGPTDFGRVRCVHD